MRRDSLAIKTIRLAEHLFAAIAAPDIKRTDVVLHLVVN